MSETDSLRDARPRAALGPLLLAVAVLLAGCSAPPITDPVAELSDTRTPARRQLEAMAILDQAPGDTQYRQTLHRVIWRPGYSIEVREAALERLEIEDFDELMRTIRQRLPRLVDWKWRARLCAIIGARGWEPLTPALVSSWAWPNVLVEDERDRPEYLALAELHGPDHVTDAVFEVMVSASKAWQQGLRTRCWTLLERLGERERLIELIDSAEIAADDAMLVDLRAAASELGLIPRNGEEVRWIRKLREAERAEFWAQAVAAVGGLPDSRRAELELRDLAVVVSAARHDPDLLAQSNAQLYARLEAYLGDQKRYAGGSAFDAPTVRSRQRLDERRRELTWGDLAAMLIAVRALQVPEVVFHLFDYADRDRADTSTEYGGIISLDAKGRFEVLEFPPKMRRHDQMFIATQAMFDAGYTAIFHFHFHAQRPRNEEFAGPGFGDRNYADNTRANCLVLTSVREDRLNVDFYRHGQVVVDLGTIARPSRTTAAAAGR